jgi:hypothetical protein
MIKRLFRSLLGLDFLPHAREVGALTIVGFTGQRGVELTETGISIERFEVRYFPEVFEAIPDNLGETRGRAISQKFSREVTIEGEVLGATGIMAAALATAVVPANDVATFGDGSGTLLLQEVTETQSRADWRKISMKLVSNPGLTLS